MSDSSSHPSTSSGSSAGNPHALEDDDLVYVDPAARAVVGKVEFDEKGNPRSRAYPKESEGGEQAWRDFCPFGTYRSMKKSFRVGGKIMEEKGQATLDDVLLKFLNDTL